MNIQITSSENLRSSIACGENPSVFVQNIQRANTRYQNLPSTTKDTKDEGFLLIKQYFEKTKFVNHQIDQFNHFVEHGLKQIVLREPVVQTSCETFSVKFVDVKVENPKFMKKIVKKNNTVSTQPRAQRPCGEQEPSVALTDTCVETSTDACYLEGGEVGSYELVPLFPNEARKRNINYDGTVSVDLVFTNKQTNKQTTHKNVVIGKLPIMLYSKNCWLQHSYQQHPQDPQQRNEECVNDYGGYFIIKGKERVLVSQIRRAYNRVYVSREESVFVAEMRSMNRSGVSVLVQLKFNPNTHELLFSLPFIKTKNLLPAGLVYLALGVSEKDMLNFCDLKTKEVVEMLQAQYHLVSDQESAINFIASEMSSLKEKDFNKHKLEKTTQIQTETTDDYDCAAPSSSADQTTSVLYTKNILDKELFYHVGDLTPTKSAVHLSVMIKKVVATAHGDRVCDDKDNLANKRADAVASLLSFLFQILFKQFTKTLHNQMEGKKNPDPLAIIKDIKNITNIFNQAFMSGSWNTQKSSLFTRVGVSQVLSMQNYGAKISHLRRLMLPIGSKGKNPNARQLHASHFSFICPFETPEGETVGIVSNMALSAHISTDTDPDFVLEHICRLKGWTPMFDQNGNWIKTTDTKRLVFLNGAVVGSCDNTRLFKQQLDLLRITEHQTMRDVGVIRVKTEDAIYVETDEGRFIRPLFAIGARNAILHKQLRSPNHNLTWEECVNRGVVVFRDVWELEQSVVALSEDDLQKNRCDYLEICPAATIMGVMASVIPLSNHCQSPRNAYQASMGKQAIGIPSTAWQFRYDTTLHILNTPQKPITKNSLVNVLKFNEMSHGAMPVVAIMTFSGFNQEDSIILNKSSIDRGLFTTTTYKTIVEEENKKGKTDIECVCLPKIQYRNRNFDYTHLNEQGIVWKPNIWLKKGTVIIGKTTKKMIKNEEGVRKPEITDTSVVIKHGEEGYLDKVLVTVNTEGTKVIKVRVRLHRIPEIGDKFASSTAQKGTCGMIFSQEDLPFDKNGITPDLIINPHAMPSRMTINMLIEMFFNRVGCELGTEMDATPFKHRNIEEELSFWAEKANLDLRSDELMDGRTGERTKAKIFMAPCFYQRLKHLVSDKIHARMTGPLDTLTHQPVAGRAKNGALRFGEMEKDALLVHGSTRVLKENLFDKSDAFHVPVCVKCGNIPNLRHTCDICGDSSIETKNLPYATKLLLQELAGMGINAIIR